MVNNLNNILRIINLKKQYFKKIRTKVHCLYPETIKNEYKSNTEDSLILYIISISFSKTNTLMHVMDFAGNLKFFYSAGLFNYTGKKKKLRSTILRKFYSILVKKLSFLCNKPLSLHLKNVGSNKHWIIKKLKKRFFFKSIKIFDSYPYNGCRKKKVRRLKIRTKKIKTNKFFFEEMAERFKAVDCKSIEFLNVGSNPAFFNVVGLKFGV